MPDDLRRQAAKNDLHKSIDAMLLAFVHTSPVTTITLAEIREARLCMWRIADDLVDRAP